MEACENMGMIDRSRSHSHSHRIASCSKPIKKIVTSGRHTVRIRRQGRERAYQNRSPTFEQDVSSVILSLWDSEYHP